MTEPSATNDLTADEHSALISETTRTYRERLDFLNALDECPDINESDVLHEGNGRLLNKAELEPRVLRLVCDYAPVYYANRAAIAAAEAEANRPRTSAEKLAELEDRVRNGEPVTASQLSAARAEVAAQSELEALVEQGNKGRAKDAQARAKARASAIAASIANPPELPAELAEAEAAAIAAIDRVRELRTSYATTLVSISKTLIENHVEARTIGTASTAVFDEDNHPFGAGYPAALVIGGREYNTEPMSAALRRIATRADHTR